MTELQFVPQTTKQLDWEVVSYADTLMALGEANGLKFWNAGRGKIITSPRTCKNGWTLVPLDQDETIIPVAGLQVVELIEKANIPYHGLVIAHEPVPIPDPMTKLTPEIDLRSVIKPKIRAIKERAADIEWEFVLKGVGKSLLVIAGVVLLPILAAIALAVIAAVVGAVVFVLGLAAAAMVACGGDPALLMLVDVDENGVGTYIGLYAWYE